MVTCESVDRVKRSRMILGAMAMFLGGACSLVAVFAYQLGLDSNPEWGPSRRLLLGVGLVGLLIGLALLAKGWLRRYLDASESLYRFQRWANDRTNRIENSPFLRTLRDWLLAGTSHVESLIERSPALRLVLGTRRRKAATTSLILWGLAVVTYVWIGSVGTWTSWPPTTSDYDLLAEGFTSWKLSLPVAPPPELLAMPDPYVMESRQYLPDLWDVSYYDGHFFLYWGPVPAALLMPIKAVTEIHLDDGILTVLFMSAVSLFAVLCLLSMWSSWPGNLPWWSVIPPVAGVVWATPLLWLPTRGAVYEVAIASGQAFLLLGLLFALPAFWGNRLSSGRLMASSASLTLAAGSRLNLGPACAVIMLLALLPEFRQTQGAWRKRWRKLVKAAAPATLGAMALLAYNFGRFGDLLEFGHKFQLGRTDIYHNYARVFTFGSVIPNLNNYFLNGVQTLSVFPYIKPDWGQYYVWLTHSYAPDGYHTEKVAGILVAIPFLWFIGYLIVQWGRSLFGSHPEDSRSAMVSSTATRVALRLLGVALVLLAPLSLYLAVSLRHEVDFVPILGLVAAAAFWHGYTRLRDRPFSRVLWGLFGGGLALTSVVLGILLAMTGFQGNFENYNPQLFHTLTSIFTF